MTIKQKSGKILQGTVVSSGKMAKTAVVVVTRYVPHPQYGKFVRRVKKFLVHDEKGVCRVGERVRIRESRPLSRRKRFIVVAS